MQVDLTGKRALITGASSGIGFEIAKGLLNLNASVIITGRDPKKLSLAADFLQKDTGHQAIETIVSDFSAMANVASVAQQASGVDMLFNNAGMLTKERQITEDGHETQWQVNFLAAAYLALTLQQSMPPTGKIINVASGAHRNGQLDLTDLTFAKRDFSPLGAYAQSKLAMILLTRHLGALWGEDGQHINAVHPGVVRTDFARDAGLLGVAFNLFKPFYRSARAGARGILNVACSPFTADQTGAYFFNSRVTTPARQALNDKTAEELYSYCCNTLKLEPSGTRQSA